MKLPSCREPALSSALTLISLLIWVACAPAAPPSTPVPHAPEPSPIPTTAPSPTSEPSPTVSPEKARVEEILAAMTTEQKVGQLFAVYFDGSHFSPALEEMITQYYIGGIIIFPRNLTSLVDLATVISDAQQAAMANNPAVPLLVAADQEGWPIWRLPPGATVFPSNMAVGATNSVEDAQLMASIMATEMRAMGINMNLAPVMDVNSNPANPIIGIRSFGSSPDLVSRLGSVMIETYQSNGIIATAKHFPGHGDTSMDSHLDLPLVEHDRARLEAVELLPFQAAISAGVDCIMTAHIHVPALDSEPDRPATLSPIILEGLLREQMGFQGLIATDSLGMQGITKQYDLPTATVLAFQAGADLLLFGPDPGHPPSEQRAAYQKLLNLVESGTISMTRLDASVRRILLTKARRGILDWQPEPLDRSLGRLGAPDHEAAARKVALDSITLVRDEGDLLPLSSQESILVIYPEGGEALGEAILEHAPHATLFEVSDISTVSEVMQATDRARHADVVVVGTRNVLQHPDQAHLVDTLRRERSVVAVALDAPYDLLSYPEVSTYLATYGRTPVSMGALALVLFGLEAPTGRLPVELPSLYPAGYQSEQSE